jgi:hypothetical protein
VPHRDWPVRATNTWGYGHFSARTIFGAAGLGLLIIGLFARFLARKLPDQILS